MCERGLTMRRFETVVSAGLVIAVSLSACSHGGESSTASAGAFDEFALVSSENANLSEEESSEAESATEQEEDNSHSESVDTTGSPYFVLDESALSPAYAAFYNKVTEERAKRLEALTDENLYEDLSITAESYMFYDANGDGSKDLGIKFGSCEADYYYEFYSYNEKKGIVESYLTLPGGHAVLYSNPGGGLIRNWGHMGYQSVEMVTFDDKGEPVYSEIASMDLNENQEAEFVKVGDVVPGAEFIPYSDIFYTFPLELENSESTDTSSGLTNDEVHEIFKDTLYNDKDVYAIHEIISFGTAPVQSALLPTKAISGYIEGKAFNEYVNGEAFVHSYAFVDANNDGQDEMLMLISAEGTPYYSLWSLQDGYIYAYSLNYISQERALVIDGTGLNRIYSTSSEYYVRPYFDKNEFFYLSFDCNDDIESKPLIDWQEY